MSFDISSETLSKEELVKQESVSSQLRSAAASLDGESDVKETWAMKLQGEVYSRNCDLVYNVTATAIRVDWETATDRAVNYSVGMTFVCLAQVRFLSFSFAERFDNERERLNVFMIFPSCVSLFLSLFFSLSLLRLLD